METKVPVPALSLRLIATVMLPFAMGYFLTLLFRTVNGPIAAQLVVEFRLDAASLGLLTSVYFLTFSVAQIPYGLLVDRFGPRRTQAAVLGIGALGALMFAAAGSLPILLLGRALIGLGTSGALMAGLKAITLWLPAERRPLANGCFIIFGGLGAMTSSVPIDLLQPAMGWRGTFLLLAIATLTSALLVFAVVPEAATGKAPEPWRDNLRGLLEIYLSRAFWQVAPLSAAVIGTAFAVHGLWAARWLADVDHFESPQVVAVLLVMGAGLTLGAGIIGIGVDRLQRLGIRSTTMFGWACLVFILLQLAVLLRVALPAWLIWGAFGGFGAMTVLSYSIIGELFPAQKIGRANGALNVLHVGMAFVLQYAMGLLAARWVPDAAGRLPTVAYRTAFALPLLLELLGIGWFWIAFRTTSQQSTTFEPSETVLR